MIEERARFIQRSNPTNSWVTYNPILRKGEIGIEETTDGRRLMKIGDGQTPWNNLPYAEPYTDKTLSLHDYAADAWAVGARVSDLESRVIVLENPKVEISTFSCAPSSFQLGNTITSVVLIWNYTNEEEVISQSINGVSIPIADRAYTFSDQSITDTTSFTLTCIDTNNHSISKTVYLTALPIIVYGAATIPSEYDSTFLNSLSSQLYDGTDTSVTINAATNKYSFICYPLRYGVKHFLFNNLEGGFAYQDTISYTNSYGYTESYYIYRSDYPSLGQIKIKIRGEV